MASMIGWDKGAQNIFKFHLGWQDNQTHCQIWPIQCQKTLHSMWAIDTIRLHQFRQADSTEQRVNITLSLQQPQQGGKFNTLELPQRLYNGGEGMYKVIMRLATLDRNATVSALKVNLCELNQYAINENRNIVIIHNYFSKVMQSSRFRGNQWMMSTPSFSKLIFRAFQMLCSTITLWDCKTTW